MSVPTRRTRHNRTTSLLVEGLGVGGGGRDVGVTGSLVRAGGELELVGGLEVGIAGGAVGGGVILYERQSAREISSDVHIFVLRHRTEQTMIAQHANLEIEKKGEHFKL